MSAGKSCVCEPGSLQCGRNRAQAIWNGLTGRFDDLIPPSGRMRADRIQVYTDYERWSLI